MIKKIAFRKKLFLALAFLTALLFLPSAAFCADEGADGVQGKGSVQGKGNVQAQKTEPGQDAVQEQGSAQEQGAAQEQDAAADGSAQAGQDEKAKKKDKKKSKKKEDEKKQDEASEKTVITIMNALKSGNKKDPNNGDELLTFEGNVQISVEKGGTKTVVSADKVSYNRKREMLFAEGAVQMEQTEASGAKQTISSDSLLLNTRTLEGVFDNSRVVKAESNAINLPSGSKITVASDLFARDDSGAISFKNGSLTFCDEEENPHWRIKASRIWLLPGNEFAFLNALVYVGPVPVMYLPAFYYPKDELIFNPVFGYRNRAGYYFQTSTYLFGRKPLDTGSSSSKEEKEDDILGDYFSLIKPTKLMEQEREGLILHNLDKEFKGDTSNYLKILLDYYTNIGFSTGLAGAFKGTDRIPSIEASAILGFSNTVFQDTGSSYWHPYAKSGAIYKDESNFMGFNLPFRYKGNLKFNGSFPFNYSLSIPVYSDPYFNYDFGDRNETMDWFSYLLNNPNVENTTKTEDQKREAAEINTFTWDSNASYTIPLPESVKPFISSLSINTFNSSIAFSEASRDAKSYTAKEIADEFPKYTPDRKFFYPSTIAPLKTGLKISGTIFSTSTTRNRTVKTDKTLAAELNAHDFEEKAEGQGEKEEKNDGEKSGGEDKEGGESVEALFAQSALPDLSFSLPSSNALTPFSYSLDYSLSPDFSSQVTYASEPLATSKDFDFNKPKSSYIQVKTPVTLNSNLSFFDSFFSVTNNISFEPYYQKHPYIADLEKDSSGRSNGGYSEADKKNLILADYKASYMKLFGSNSITLKPLVYFKHFKDTSVSWNTNINWVRTEFIGDADNPDWDYLTVDWTDKESITSHTMSATLAANEFDERFKQSLTLTATLPPQVDKYYGTLNLTFPYVTLTGETGISKKSATDSTWKKEPFRQSMSVSLFNSKLKLTESYNYDMEENRHDDMKLALSYEGLQASYTMRYTTTYDFDSDKGWVADKDKDFVPYSFSLAYSSSNKKFKAWKNRIEITPGLSTSISYDFVRPTQSYFIFTPSVTFRLNKLFYIKFAAESRNDVIYRYFQDAAGHPGRIPGETNPIIDLLNGFRFDDESLRKSSGFKLKSFIIQMTHELHDWDFNMKFKVSPRLISDSSGKKHYDFSPYFSLSVVWRPMDSIKTKIADKYGDFVLNSSDKDE